MKKKEPIIILILSAIVIGIILINQTDQFSNFLSNNLDNNYLLIVVFILMTLIFLNIKNARKIMFGGRWYEKKEQRTDLCRIINTYNNRIHNFKN